MQQTAPPVRQLHAALFPLVIFSASCSESKAVQQASRALLCSVAPSRCLHGPASPGRCQKIACGRSVAAQEGACRVGLAHMLVVALPNAPAWWPSRVLEEQGRSMAVQGDGVTATSRAPCCCTCCCTLLLLRTCCCAMCCCCLAPPGGTLPDAVHAGDRGVARRAAGGD